MTLRPSLRTAGAGSVAACAACLVSSPSALAQTLGGGGMDVEVSWWRVILGVVVSLILAVVAAVALKARTQGVAWKAAWPSLFSAAAGRPRRVEALESFRVNPQTEVCLLRWDGREYLIAVAGSHVAVLDSREAQPKEPVA